MTERPPSAAGLKEALFESQRRSRGQKDFRAGPPASPSPPDAGGGYRQSPEAVRLVARYRLPSIAWPGPVPATFAMDVARDRFRGCLLWGAVGDALGRPAEGRSPGELQAQFGPRGIETYVPWRGWRSGPKGTVTDDTQLTIEVARNLCASGGDFDPDGFARQLAAWLPHARGIGHGTARVVEALDRGVPWWVAAPAVDSGGNGAAMRAAPIGLAWALHPSPRSLLGNAVLSAVVTHTHPVAVAGAVALAAGVAWCVRESLAGQQHLDSAAFLDFVGRAIEGIEPHPTSERRPQGREIRLRERIAELADLLTRDRPEEVFAYTYNGAFALESVPAALYCFLRSPDDPRQVILTAVNAGYDADTVASMAGNLVGAWRGVEHLHSAARAWWDELEYRDDLINLADGLLSRASQNRAH